MAFVARIMHGRGNQGGFRRPEEEEDKTCVVGVVGGVITGALRLGAYKQVHFTFRGRGFGFVGAGWAGCFLQRTQKNHHYSND